LGAVSHIGKLGTQRPRLCVITGAASGIGRAIAQDLIEHGYAAALFDIKPIDWIDKSDTTLPLACDVSDEAAVINAFAATAEHFGRPPWACFANAGVSGGSDQFIDVTGAKFRRLVEINLLGAFFTMREAAIAMTGSGGRIVATSSIAGVSGTPLTGVPYAAAKAGVINMVKQAAIRLAPYGITVNAICPGPIETEAGDGAMHDPEVAAHLASGVPLRRVGQPSEIVGLTRLLASEESSYITGQIIAVDGGATAVTGAPLPPLETEPVLAPRETSSKGTRHAPRA
jgi:NAD(P)-dependent dehydrogenase (short-subunit alcohol dehydrogenase family)